MATGDLISREAAVREALAMYHALAARRDACQRAKDAGGTVMWTAAAEIAQAMVRRLMELPEAAPRPRARWVPRVPPLTGGDAAPMCSACCRTSDAETMFCPWCGAEMEEEKK